jgi:hypothetical protein
MTSVYQSLFTNRSSRYVAPPAPTSVHWLCLQATYNRIVELKISGLASTSIVSKKLPTDRFLGSLKALGVKLPAVILFPLPETQDPTKGTNLQDDVMYGVGCLTIQKDNQEPTVAIGMSSWFQWRQQINRAVRNQSFDALPPTVMRVLVTPSSLYDAVAWENQFAVSYLILRFHSREPRGLNA